MKTLRGVAPVALLAAAAAALPMAGCSGGGAGDGQNILKIASVLPAEHPSSRALEFFQQRIKELSGGTLEVQLFLNSQLGNNEETLESCRIGNTAMIFSSSAPLATYNEQLHALSMPFLFRDLEHQHAVADGPVGGEIKAEVGKTGLVCLAFFDAGFRSLMTKKGPIRTPEDVKGMKIRVMNSPVMIATINAFGASAVGMNQGEVYSALQTGYLDGWENNLSTTLSFRMYETGCKYLAWTRHISIPDLLLMNKAWYERLTPEQRRVVDQAANEAQAKQRELWAADEKAAYETLTKAGMEFNEPDAAAFRACTTDIYEENYKKRGEAFKKLCEDIQGVQ